MNRQDYLKGKMPPRTYPTPITEYKVGDKVISSDGRVVGTVTEISHDVVFLDAATIVGDIVPLGVLPAYRKEDFIRHE